MKQLKKIYIITATSYFITTGLKYERSLESIDTLPMVTSSKARAIACLERCSNDNKPLEGATFEGDPLNRKKPSNLIKEIVVYSDMSIVATIYSLYWDFIW